MQRNGSTFFLFHFVTLFHFNYSITKLPPYCFSYNYKITAEPVFTAKLIYHEIQEASNDHYLSNSQRWYVSMFQDRGPDRSSHG